MSPHSCVFVASVTVEDESLSLAIVTVETGDVSIGSLVPSASLVGELLLLSITGGSEARNSALPQFSVCVV